MCVPPSNVSREGASAINSAGSTVCSTSVALPAVPTLKRYSPGRTACGSNVIVREPTSAPLTRPSQQQRRVDVLDDRLAHVVELCGRKQPLECLVRQV